MSRRRSSTVPIALAFAGALIASACSNPKPSVSVEMVDFTYKPVHVTIQVGESVTFRNGTHNKHNFTLLRGGSVTFDVDSGTSATTSDLGTLKPGAYPFECKYHFRRGMVGLLVVTGAGSP